MRIIHGYLVEWAYLNSHLNNTMVEICYTTSVGKIKTFAQAKRFLYSYIPKRRKHRFPGELGLRRARKLLELLGKPQEKMQVVHVAGTSGKGSVAYLTSHLLHCLGLKTGFHVSPHLVDICERCQINNKLISKKKFVGYLNEIVPAIKTMESTAGRSVRFLEDARDKECTIVQNRDQYPLRENLEGRRKKILSHSCVSRPTYFEILTALAFYIFWREGVECAVMETGLGGRYDATNTVDRKDKLCILTRIGKDHTRILGHTLGEIAQQKAGIIQKGNPVVALRQKREVVTAIERRAKEKKADLYWVGEGEEFVTVKIGREFSVFHFQFADVQLRNVQLGLLGRHQVENASLALAAVAVCGFFSLRHPRGGLTEKNGGINEARIVSVRCPRGYPSEKNGVQVNLGKYEKIIRKALSSARFAGRLEIFKVGEREVVLDGAHNPQKMRALIASLRQIFPGERFTFLLAFSRSKDATSMLKTVLPLAERIILTSFVIQGQDVLRVAQEATRVGQILQKLGFVGYEIVEDAKAALMKALGAGGEGKLVITGSLYLVGKLYRQLKNKEKEGK